MALNINLSQFASARKLSNSELITVFSKLSELVTLGTWKGPSVTVTFSESMLSILEDFDSLKLVHANGLTKLYYNGRPLGVVIPEDL